MHKDLSIYLSIYQAIYLSVYLSTFLSTYLSINLSIYLVWPGGLVYLTNQPGDLVNLSHLLLLSRWLFFRRKSTSKAYFLSPPWRIEQIDIYTYILLYIIYCFCTLISLYLCQLKLCVFKCNNRKQLNYQLPPPPRLPLESLLVRPWTNFTLKYLVGRWKPSQSKSGSSNTRLCYGRGGRGVKEREMIDRSFIKLHNFVF